MKTKTFERFFTWATALLQRDTDGLCCGLAESEEPSESTRWAPSRGTAPKLVPRRFGRTGTSSLGEFETAAI
jgi:hypothetical protein